MTHNTTPGDSHPARLNALKHGLRSESFVLPGVESIEEWESFRDDLLESLQPVGHLEAEMAQRVAHLAWRLRRALRAEHDSVGTDEKGDVHTFVRNLVGLISQLHEESCGAALPLELGPVVLPALGEAGQPTLPGESALNKIMRYEAQYTRQLFQTLHALQALQAKRHGREIPTIRVQWN